MKLFLEKLCIRPLYVLQPPLVFDQVSTDRNKPKFANILQEFSEFINQIDYSQGVLSVTVDTISVRRKRMAIQIGPIWFSENPYTGPIIDNQAEGDIRFYIRTPGESLKLTQPHGLNHQGLLYEIYFSDAPAARNLRYPRLLSAQPRQLGN